MNMDILVPVVTLTGIAVTVGCVLNGFARNNSDKFDERQLIERGRGANLAMAVAMVYLLGLYAGLLLDWLPGEYATVFAVYGLVVMLMVDDFWCIFHDAYLMPGQDVWHVALTWGFVGCLWLVTAMTRSAFRAPASMRTEMDAPLPSRHMTSSVPSLRRRAVALPSTMVISCPS